MKYVLLLTTKILSPSIFMTVINTLSDIAVPIASKENNPPLPAMYYGVFILFGLIRLEYLIARAPAERKCYVLPSTVRGVNDANSYRLNLTRISSYPAGFPINFFGSIFAAVIIQVKRCDESPAACAHRTVTTQCHYNQTQLKKMLTDERSNLSCPRQYSPEFPEVYHPLFPMETENTVLKLTNPRVSEYRGILTLARAYDSFKLFGACASNCKMIWFLAGTTICDVNKFREIFRGSSVASDLITHDITEVNFWSKLPQ